MTSVLMQSSLLQKIRDVLRANEIRCEIDQPPAPLSGEQSARMPYSIIYGIEGGTFDGPMGAPEAAGISIVQVTSAGKSGLDASRQADKVRRILLDRDESGQGYARDLDTDLQMVGGRWSYGLPGHIDQGAVFSAAERFGFALSFKS